MKPLAFNTIIHKIGYIAILLIFAVFTNSYATELTNEEKQPIDSVAHTIFSGEVLENETGKPLIFATLSVTGTNIATVCNSEGKFSIKVPDNMLTESLQISFIGYKTKAIKIADLSKSKNKIKLEMINVTLAEVSVFPKDPEYLIQAVLERRTENYMDSPIMMTSFYRETIKMGRHYVSLSEAVVDVLKQSYKTTRPDQIQLHKARKSADYDKLDTLVFKLMGGPHSAVMLDMMKDPYLVLTDNMFDYYTFNLNTVTRINDRLIYILEFTERVDADIPLYSGKLYIDSESLAITSATYNLNVSDKQAAAEMFIKKKPAGARVYPTEASYMVNYREKDGKWFYSYSRGQLNFRVNWKKKLFNTNYFATIEMATTNWEPSENKSIKAPYRLKSNVIMEEAALGFADKNFWGEYNVIEPEKSIDIAIKKIKKNLTELK